MISAILLCLFFSSTIISLNGQQSCGLEGSYIDITVTDSFDTDFPIAVKESFNVAFVHSIEHHTGYTSNYFGNIKTQLVTNASGKWIEFYLERGDIMDINRKVGHQFRLTFRCLDGSYFAAENVWHYVGFEDSNNRAPEFSDNSYTFQIPLPWPSQIPITLTNNILVRDLDYKIENSQVDISLGRPDVLTAELTSLTPVEFSRDYKLDLFITPYIFPGNYTVSLEATDGVHNTVVPINLIVTDVVCRAHLSDPVFGRKDKITQTLYQASLNEFPLVGDVLSLKEGVNQIEAYDPEDLCLVDLTVDVDYLEINSNGQLIVSRKLSQQEIDSMKPYTVAEITATKRGTGRNQKVPLIVNITQK